MLERAGYESVAKGLDAKLVAQKVDEVETAAREMAVKEHNTVTHNRGTDIFEAGAVRFGLEMRDLGFDGGLAIHVLGDVAGQEIELLAFDCFRGFPHYHYGPRNENERIYWDKTLVTDYLGWVLDKFDSKKLGPMIERAGYPGVAADLDQDKIDAILPAMTKRAREMEAMGEELTGHLGLPLEPTPNLVTG